MGFFSTINAFYVLLGSVLLGAAGGLLGSFAVLRKQGLLGDTLAHAALPGVAVAFLLMEVKFLPGLLLGALGSALLGAAFIYLLTTRTKIKMDTAMASVLSVFFGVGILLLTYIQKLPLSAQSGLQGFLFGQAAALVKNDVIWMAVFFLAIILMVMCFWKELKIFVFDRDFAQVLGFKRWILELLFMTIFVAAILMCLQAVGVVLTAAVFITPAVAALMWSNRLVMVVCLSTFFGILAGFGGATLSAMFSNTPTGPVIVVILTVIFAASFLFAPRKGIVHKWLVHKKYSAKVEMENVLGRFFREMEKGSSIWKLQDYKDFGYKMGILKSLVKRKFVKLDAGELSLTAKGMEESRKVIEKHRLWETYLVENLSLAPDHVHRDAEMMEHALDDNLVKELRRELGNPKKDPHGKPIKK